MHKPRGAVCVRQIVAMVTVVGRTLPCARPRAHTRAPKRRVTRACVSPSGAVPEAEHLLASCVGALAQVDVEGLEACVAEAEDSVRRRRFQTDEVLQHAHAEANADAAEDVLLDSLAALLDGDAGEAEYATLLAEMQALAAAPLDAADNNNAP